MLIVLPKQNEDEVIDEDVVTGTAEFVVIAEWEFDGACCVRGCPFQQLCFQTRELEKSC